SDLTIGNGIQIVLAGGARAANIFWQVGTSANLGTTSVFKGTILADQSISMNTGASLEGRALARIAAVTLTSNTITHPGAVTSLRGTSGTSRTLMQQANAENAIEFSVSQSGAVTLKLFTTSGQEIATFIHANATAGERNTISLHGKNIPRGLYFSKLES